MLRSALLLSATFAFGFAPKTEAEAEAAQPPNIVVILADDLGYGDPGALNADSKIPTPNLDRLARQSLSFVDAHTPSAVCTPTRYALLTGRYCWRSSLKRGVLWGRSAALIEPERWTIASMLQDQGYATMGVGKWHLGLGAEGETDYSKPLRPGPVTVGFDHYFGIPASLDMEPYVYIRDDGVEAEPTETIEASAHRRQNGGGYWRAGGIAPGFRHIDVLPRIEQESVAFLESQAERDARFFLYVPLSAPHTPWLPLDEYRGRSEAGYYGDFVAQVDATVGRILETLEASGQADDTLVVFTSDNGAHWPEADIKEFNHRANGPWRGQKADIHEGGHRVPFFVRWPGVTEAGSTCEETICLTDLMATLAAVVGVALPDDQAEDSFDLTPLLRGEPLEGSFRPATIHHSARGMFAIRAGDWKLIEGRGSGGFTAPAEIDPETLEPGAPVGQLYNLAEDPAEQHNLYNERPEVVEALKAQLERIRNEGRSRPTGDPDE